MSHHHLRQLKRRGKNLNHHGFRSLGVCLTECQGLVTSFLVWVWPGVRLVSTEEGLKCLFSNLQPLGLALPPPKSQWEPAAAHLFRWGQSHSTMKEVLAASASGGLKIDIFLKSGIAN